MVRYLIVLALFLAVSCSKENVKHAMLFSGGVLYDDIKKNSPIVKESGFNTLVLWSMHINENGDLIYNGPVLISDGEYVGHEWWPAEVEKLKEDGSSITRMEFSIGAWEVPDFENIQALIEAEGTGPTSTLYRNFKKLKEILPLDAIDFDDESNYDVASTVAFSKMLIDLGYQITLCPYKNKPFWKSVYNQVSDYSSGSVDRIYLQCYAGGAKNNPAEWNVLFDGLNVIPGLWCKNGEECSLGDSPEEVKNKLAYWDQNSTIDGGFIWVFDDLLKCDSNSTSHAYATAILQSFGPDTK